MCSGGLVPGKQVFDERAYRQKLIEAGRLGNEVRNPEIRQPGPVSPGL